MTDYLSACPLPPYLQLIDGRPTKGIRRSQHNRLPLLFVISAELANRRRFSGSVDSYDQQNRRAFTSLAGHILAAMKNLCDLLLQKRPEIFRRTDLFLPDSPAYRF